MAVLKRFMQQAACDASILNACAILSALLACAGVMCRRYGLLMNHRQEGVSIARGGVVHLESWLQSSALSRASLIGIEDPQVGKTRRQRHSEREAPTFI